MTTLLAQTVPYVDIQGWFDRALTALLNVLEPVFDVLASVVSFLVGNLEGLLLLPPPLVLTGLAVVLAWYARGVAFATFSAVAFVLIQAMGFWDVTMQTLALTLVAALFAVAVGVPFGILAARVKAVSDAVKPVLDFMQTMPAFIYLLVAILAFGIGTAAGVAATFIFGMPPAVRLTELGIRQVDEEVVEAAEAFGARPSQVLRGVQIPLAVPTIMAGVNQVIMLSLSMVVIAGLGGAQGLGTEVVRAITRLDLGLGAASGLAVVILAVFLDRITAAASPAGTAPAGTA